MQNKILSFQNRKFYQKLVSFFLQIARNDFPAKYLIEVISLQTRHASKELQASTSYMVQQQRI